jgi:hypothetical protein
MQPNGFYFSHMADNQTVPARLDNQLFCRYERRKIRAFPIEKADVAGYATRREPRFPELIDHDPAPEVLFESARHGIAREGPVFSGPNAGCPDTDQYGSERAADQNLSTVSGRFHSS